MKSSVENKLAFDISAEELPIFQAETDEQLQTLDEGLVRLERAESDADLLQALFRAAHTLKGAAGMIGHKRLVSVTHNLETVFDGVRKGRLAVTPHLVDLCLEAIDVLRILCAEVSDGVASDIEINGLVENLTNLANSSSPDQANRKVIVPGNGAPPALTSSAESITILAMISADCFAPAARALQLMMALQELGDIVDMRPSQSEIESGTSVHEFRAIFRPRKGVNSEAINETRRYLAQISDIERLLINNESGESRKIEETVIEQTSPVVVEEIPRIGDLLVQAGMISQEQLQEALKASAAEQGPAALIGKTLMRLGYVTQEVLDEIVADQSQQKKARTEAGTAVEKSAAKGKPVEKTVRTSVERLDKLMNLVGELITDRNRLNMIKTRLELSYRGQENVETLGEAVAHLGRITDQLQTEVMGIRMLPISNVFSKFPRLVRDLARDNQKQIDLVIRGEDTELDRSVVEEINDPLIHLLRNAVDHGIESPEVRRAAGKPERGTILLTARHEQGRIVLTVEDDGQGIDIERVKAKAVDKGFISAREAETMAQEDAIDLIFMAGLSTAKIVSNISGRGVGMDIVRNNIERLNGHIVVDTRQGQGTRFQIVLPLTLAIVPTLLVSVELTTFAIPLVTVTETLRVAMREIHTIKNRPVIQLRDRVLPVMRLSDVFGYQTKQKQLSRPRYEYVVVVRSGKTQLGLIVDRLVGEQDVVVKALGLLFGETPGVSSAAILGDGQVALILDIQSLIKMASLHQFDMSRSEQAEAIAQEVV